MRTTVIAGLLFAVSLRAGAQVLLPTATPAEAGLDAARLAEAVALYREAVEADEIKGTVLLVARGGRVALEEAVGRRLPGDLAPMNADVLFRLASNTKPAIAALAMMLVEEGKLGLDDPAGKWVPAFDTDGLRPVRVRHLLSHTGGLAFPGIFVTPLLERSDDRPDAPCLRLEAARFAASGLKEAPGTVYSYSNAGYNLLGAVIEAAAGIPLARLFRERLYAPLGMADARNLETEADPARMAQVCRKSGDAWKTEWSPGEPPAWPFVRASGGMIATARDYARFCQMILDGGKAGARILLSAESVAQMTRRQTPEQRKGGGYGFGWMIGKDGAIEHGGSDGTSAWIDPSRKLIGIVFTQSPGGKAPLARFRELVTAACR